MSASNGSNPVLPGIRLAGAASYLLINVVSLLLSIFLAVVLWKSGDLKSKRTFFIIIVQHLISDMMSEMVQLTLVVPATFAGYNIYEDIVLFYDLPHLIAFFDTVAYNGQLYFSFLLTINRFSVFIFPKLNVLLFTGKRVYVTIALVWFIIAVFVILTNVGGCRKSFNFEKFYLWHDCVKDISQFLWFMKMWGSYTSTYFPAIMMVMYIALIAYTRLSNFKVFANFSWNSQVNSKRRKREFSMLIQSFLICVCLEIQNISFLSLPKIKDDLHIITFVQNWIVLLSSFMNPLVVFIFNGDLRTNLFMLLGVRSSKIQVAVTRFVGPSDTRSQGTLSQ
ncbi:hypothetical protein QR680_003892 [Steinernema hermaphroditum]|uniref:G-protein coupled receptors family 1 profile domain-containing protein n=1 Tax=Steinernema hermaphroditum TaxID=289476 RepID=A0AA39LT49_9BILA|nr:hypothetical protein QR680_003892 [Steinernema hermaphroditum]